MALGVSDGAGDCVGREPFPGRSGEGPVLSAGDAGVADCQTSSGVASM